MGSSAGCTLPEAILFDLDDTIVSFDGVCDPAWEEVCCAFCARTGSFEADLLLQSIYAVKEWYWGDPERHRTGRLDILAARREVVRMAFERLGAFNELEAFELADGYSRRQEEMIHLFPGAVETLEELQRRGIRMGLITNGMPLTQRAKIDRFHLEKYFEFCLIEGEVGFGKPDVRVFELALEKLGLPASEVWMIGDNLVWDVAAPQKLGITGIWNDYLHKGLPAGSPVIPDRIIHAIRELIEPTA